jgi:predicted TIM-barrel fold metal-dependent hydrolase
MVIDGFTLFGAWPGMPNDHPVEHLVEGLQRFQVDRACALSSQGVFFDAAAGNRTTWDACRADARLAPIGVADPRVRGPEQVAYCRETGFRLMALFPDSQGWAVDNLAAREVLRDIAAAGMPVMIESMRPGDASRIHAATRDLDTPVILLDVSLHVLAEAVAVLRDRPRTYVTTRLLCGGDTVEYLAQTVGPDRLIFASRFPISCFSSAFLTAKFADIDAPARAAVMGGNMAGLLA